MIIFWILIAVLAFVFTLFILIPLVLARLLFSVFFLAVVVPLIALILYGALGNSHQIASWFEQEKQAQAVMSQFKSPGEVVSALQKRLKQDPESVKGWYLLAKLYMDQQEYQKAAEALARANQLDPDQPELMAEYAQALFFVNGRLLNPKLNVLLNKILTIDPNNIDALNVLAMGAYNAKDYQKAVYYWQKILPLLEENSEEQNLVTQMITKAQAEEVHK